MLPIRHTEPSLVCSLDDDVGPNPWLFDLALAAVGLANQTTIDLKNNTNLPDSGWANVFPGEHYRFLNAVVGILKPQVVIEVGTSSGLGTRSLLQSLPPSSRLITFDLIPWNQFHSHLGDEDFEQHDLVQYLDDVRIPHVWEHYQHVFKVADLIFVDIPRDGNLEYLLMNHLETLPPRENRILIFDDIRLMDSIELWRRITSPKMDITSFGHWSGTGIVDISQGLSWIKK
jgi:hypothetical protein